MKKFLKPNILPWFTMGAGGIGLALRLWFQAGLDEKGLLPAKHPGIVLSFLLTVLVLVVLFLCTRQLAPIGKYSLLFPASFIRAAGCAIGAAGALYGGIYYLSSGILGIATFVLGLAAAGSFGFLAFLRLKGRRPPMALHTIVTLFFMLFTVCNCRIWSSEPQVQVYFYPLLACVLLMLTAYHTTVADVRKCSRQLLVLCGQGALFCSCLSLAGKTRFFYLTMILWLALDLCSLKKVRATEPTEGA